MIKSFLKAMGLDDEYPYSVTSSFTAEISRWLDQNCGKSSWMLKEQSSTGYDTDGFVICVIQFKRREDMLAFKMRWLI